MERKKIINHIGNIFMIIVFCCTLLVFLIWNIGELRSAFVEQQIQNGITQEKLLNVEQRFQENIYRRTSFINLYGITLNIFQEKIVGNFDFVKDDHGIIQRFSREQDYTPFLTSILNLENYLKDVDTALAYVTMPDKAKYLQMTDEYVFDGQQSRMVGELLQGSRIDCIDVYKLLMEDPTAPPFEEFFFKTDVHCSTYGEFWLAKELVQHLETQYSLVFSNRETVFDLSNYTIDSYAFLGNTARSVGKYFVGLDEFEIYKPNFETSLTLNNPSASEIKTGDFENVMLNGYENGSDISEYTYWVTDFGRFTSPRYEYTNHNAPDDAPSVLIISDSAFMRGFSYLALACQKVTVVDPRYFGGTEYLAAELAGIHYDAVVVIGISVNFFSKKFEASITLPDIPTVAMISREDYGEWIANQGICLDTYNGIRLEGSTTITIDPAAASVKLYGWAADFCNDAPFQTLYLQVGEVLLRCDYDIERDGVVSHFGKDSLLKTGFQITFPVDFLQEGAVTEVSFIGVSADGQYLYTPVTYQLMYP